MSGQGNIGVKYPETALKAIDGQNFKLIFQYIDVPHSIIDSSSQIPQQNSPLPSHPSSIQTHFNLLQIFTIKQIKIEAND